MADLIGVRLVPDHGVAASGSEFKDVSMGGAKQRVEISDKVFVEGHLRTDIRPEGTEPLRLEVAWGLE